MKTNLRLSSMTLYYLREKATQKQKIVPAPESTKVVDARMGGNSIFLHYAHFDVLYANFFALVITIEFKIQAIGRIQLVLISCLSVLRDSMGSGTPWKSQVEQDI